MTYMILLNIYFFYITYNTNKSFIYFNYIYIKKLYLIKLYKINEMRSVIINKMLLIQL